MTPDTRAFFLAQMEAEGIDPNGVEAQSFLARQEHAAKVDALLSIMKEVEQAPTMVPCARCKGRGYHHGFGEHGHDPDWCLDCGGGQYEHDARADAERILGALEAAS